MKLARLLIAGLVVSTLVLAGVTLWHRTSPRVADVAAATTPSAPGAHHIAIAAPLEPVAAWQALRHDDLGTFARNLRNAGLGDHLVRAIITAEIEERFRTREEALAPRRPPLNYWQHDSYREPLEIRLARLDLKREKARLQLELLGPDPRAAHDSAIPAGKLEFARMITEDYNALLSEVRGSQWEMSLPVEKSTRETLEAERRRELEALLTPEELSEYHYRTSWHMQQMRQQLATFEATEAEFRSIYELRHVFEEMFNRGPHDVFGREGETQEQRAARLSAAHEAKQTAERQLDEDLRRALGDTRYRSYQRETDGHLQAVRDLAERAGVPRANAEQLYDLRAALAQESARIGADTASTMAARTAALRSLALNFRTRTQILLGPDATVAYLGKADWLRHLEQGSVIKFTENGWSAFGINPPPPPPKP